MRAPKTAGMIGGLGPESTIAYYRTLIAMYRQRSADGSYPRLLMNSLDVTKGLHLVGAGKLDELAEYLVGGLQQLAAAGADFGFISANTPHVVFDEVQRASPIPLLSIVEATCAKAKELGLARLGIFGTRFTMEGRFYRDACAKAGIELAVPDEDQLIYIHEKYVNELVNGIMLPETRDGLLQIVDAMRATRHIDGLILGGTELPLLLTDDVHAGVPFLDTTAIHVARIVDEMLS
jgi:aspartate racemase